MQDVKTSLRRLSSPLNFSKRLSSFDFFPARFFFFFSLSRCNQLLMKRLDTYCKKNNGAAWIRNESLGLVFFGPLRLLLPPTLTTSHTRGLYPSSNYIVHNTAWFYVLTQLLTVNAQQYFNSTSSTLGTTEQCQSTLPDEYAWLFVSQVPLYTC